MPWHAHLELDYRTEPDRPEPDRVETNQAEKARIETSRAATPRTVARHQHSGPLRILQSLYPEGHAICHNVLVHPPGGLVGGDTLKMDISAYGKAHGLITTPGATRFYKSLGEPALQTTRIGLHDQARLEWLPMEAICHDGCLAENRLVIDLAPQAELIGWDITALGLPHASQPFLHGSFCQHIELPGVWLERGRIDATDTRLMDGPLGLAGHRCMASLFFACGSTLERGRRQAALDIAREFIDVHALHDTAGATSPGTQVVVVRVLAPVVEPAMDLLRKIWAAWRSHFWQLTGSSPRIWST
jgi:urease accessory protein